jgi:hypothetical protein
MNTKPIHEIRLGAIKAAIWKNDTDAGPRYNTTFSRLFKNGDNWESTDSFGRDDLLLVGKVADHVHSWIFRQQAQPPAPRPAPPAPGAQRIPAARA